jgi:hypothetical protein
MTFVIASEAKQSLQAYIKHLEIASSLAFLAMTIKLEIPAWICRVVPSRKQCVMV